MMINHQLLAASCLGLGFTSAANAAVVDEFFSPEFLEVVFGGSSYNQLDQSNPVGIGGARDFGLSVTGGAFVTAHISNSTSALNVGASAGSTATLDLSYDTLTVSDLTFDNSEGFQVLFSKVQGAGTVAVTVDGETSSSYAFAADNDYAAVYIPFSEFSDVTSVSQIGFTITTTEASTDFTLDSIGTTVPEPASAALVGLGALAMVSRRRRA